MDMDQVVIDMTKELNEKNILDNVKVPILKGYEELEFSGTIFTAASITDSLEQFLCDGIITEPFEEHIEKVIKDTLEAMKEGKLEVNDNTIFYLSDYHTKDFYFKVYVQDNIGEGMIIRQFNMYFMDPKTNAFYQLSLTTAPYPTSQMEYVTNEFSHKMLPTLKSLMDQVHY